MPTLALMLAFAAAVTLFDGLQVVGAMGLRAQGVVWLPTLIHVGSYIVVMLPLCVWLAFGPDRFPGGLSLGVWGVFIGISVASVAAGVGQVLALEIKSRMRGARDRASRRWWRKADVRRARARLDGRRLAALLSMSTPGVP